jgi:hypothetical protein
MTFDALNKLLFDFAPIIALPDGALDREPAAIYFRLDVLNDNAAQARD